MTTAATSLLGLALPVTGELSGTWGDTVNNSITSLLDSAVAGTTTLSTDADVTLTTTTLAANQARQAILLCSGARTAIRTITAPAQSKIYTVINSTTGGYAVKIVGVGPTTGVTIGSGQSAQVAWNGSDFVQVGASAGGSNTQVQYNNSGALAGSANLTFNGTTLTANALTVTNATTLSAGTANGVAYLNGSKVVTTGSALTFNGTNLGLSSSAVATAIKIDGSGRYKQFETYQSGSREFYFGYDSTSLIGLIYQDNNRPIAFGISGSEGMRLTSTGLGIGTSSPAYKLDVSASVARIKSTSAYSGLGLWSDDSNASTRNWLVASSYNNYGDLCFVQSTTQGGNPVGGTVRATIDSSGNLGIGTSSPSGRITVSTNGSGGVNVNESTNATATYGYLTVSHYTNGAFISTVAGSNAGADILRFGTGNTERMRLDSSGNLGLGVTPSAWNSTSKAFQVSTFVSVSQQASGAANFGFNFYEDAANTFKYSTTDEACRFSALTTGGFGWFTAASGTAGNAITFTQAMTLDASGNLGLGITSPTVNLHVYNASSAETRIASANIGLQLYSSEGAGTSVIGTYTNHALVFRTNVTERARIDSSGNLLIGTTSSDGSRLRVYGSYQTLGDGSYEGLIGKASSLVSGGGTGEFAIRSSSSLLFATNGNTERARIDSSGNFMIATTTAGAGIGWSPKLTVDASGTFGPLFKTNSAGFEALDLWNSATSGTRYQVYFRDGTGGARGSITTDGANTAFNTSSDYRLKDNPQPLTGSGAFIDALKPKTWVWKETGAQGVGFIAHEVQEVSPGSVVGEKDGEKMQQMEYGSAEFIANIIAELQSLRARVAQLETK